MLSTVRLRIYLKPKVGGAYKEANEQVLTPSCVKRHQNPYYPAPEKEIEGMPIKL